MLVADYASDDEFEVPVENEQVVEKTEEVKAPPTITTKKRKRKSESSKKRRSAREVASALGLDKEIEEILNNDANVDEEEILRPLSKKRRVEKLLATEIVHKNERNDRSVEDEDFGFNEQHDIPDNTEEKDDALGDEFFDNLHEYKAPKPPTTVQYQSTTAVDYEQQEYVDIGEQQQQHLPSSLPTDVLKDLEKGSAIVDINSDNRTTKYLGEAQERKILIDRHKQQIYAEDENAIAMRRLALNQTQRSRNQLNYLAHTAQLNQLEQAEKFSTGKATRRATKNKYGW